MYLLKKWFLITLGTSPYVAIYLTMKQKMLEACKPSTKTSYNQRYMNSDILARLELL